MEYKPLTLEDRIIVSDINIGNILSIDTNYLSYIGLGTDFVIAGQTINDVISDKKLYYVDFWIFKEKGFTQLLKYLEIFKPKYYNIYPSYIEIDFINYDYTFRLINVIGSNIIDLINMFDIDIDQCYYDGKEIYSFPTREKALKTKLLTVPTFKSVIHMPHNFRYYNDDCDSDDDTYNSVYMKDKLFCYADIADLINDGYHFSYKFCNYYNIVYLETNQEEQQNNNQEEQENQEDNCYCYKYKKYVLSTKEKEKLNTYIKREKTNKHVISLTELNQVEKILPLIYKNIVKNMVELYIKQHKLSFNTIITHLHNSFKTKHVYRNFVISNDSYKQIVDKFYENNSAKYNNINPHKINIKTDDIPIEELTNILDIYDKNVHMLSKDNKNDNTSDYKIKYNEFIKNTYVKLINYYLNKVHSCNTGKITEGSSLLYNIELCKILIKYQNILNNQSLEFDKFKITLKHKYLSIAAYDGCIYSWLTFANFCPELVTKDCYPFINIKSCNNKKSLDEFEKCSDVNIKNLYNKYYDLICNDKNENIEYTFENCHNLFENKTLTYENYYNIYTRLSVDCLRYDELSDYNNNDNYSDFEPQ